MKVIVDVSIVPLGVGVSLSPYVATCEKILADAGLKTQLHANGTDVEGEWDVVFNAIRRCHEAVHEMQNKGPGSTNSFTPAVKWAKFDIPIHYP